MNKQLQQIINKAAANPKKLFLVDGSGALLSAFMLGVVLVSLEPMIGMPRNILYYLALGACMLAVYSFSCYFLLKRNWKPFLNIIATANLLYCGITIGLVFQLHQELTPLGHIYFLLELAIILVLVYVELKTATKLTTAET